MRPAEGRASVLEPVDKVVSLGKLEMVKIIQNSMEQTKRWILSADIVSGHLETMPEIPQLVSGLFCTQTN